MWKNSELMQSAIEAVENGMSISQAAKEYGIPRQTLKDRISNRFEKEGSGRCSELTPDEEDALLKYIKYMASCSHPLSVAQIKAFAWAIIKKSNRPTRFNEENGPGWTWWKFFKRRYYYSIFLGRVNIN